MRKKIYSYILVLSLHYARIGNIHCRGLSTDSSFEHLLLTHVSTNGTFVDKSLFIREFLLNAGNRVVITRPRKWGKSINLNMLNVFLTMESESSGIMDDGQSNHNKLMFSRGEYTDEVGVNIRFPELKISQYPDAMAHQGAHPTFYMDLSRISISQYTQEQFRKALSNYIGDIFADYPFLRGYSDDEKSFTKIERRRLKRFKESDLKDDDIPYSISLIAKVFYRHFNNTPVYVLVDEYDFFVNEFFSECGANSKTFRGVVKHLRNMFHSAFNNEESFIGKVLLTGTLPFLRSDAQMEDFEFYTAAEDGKFSRYYGITSTELDELLDREETLTHEHKDKIKAYYNGYSSDGETIYNVWSITSCLFFNGVIGNFWKSSGQVIDRYTKKAILSDNVVRYYEDLIAFKEIESNKISKDLNYSIISEDEGAFSLLLHKGYLTISGGNDTHLYYKIPNSDVRSAYVAEHKRRLENNESACSTPQRSEFSSDTASTKPYTGGWFYTKRFYEIDAKDVFVGESEKSSLELTTVQEDESLYNEDGSPFNKTQVIEKLVTDYNAVFQEKIGKVPNFKATLRIRANVTPKFVEPRKASRHLLQLMAEELSVMERNGIITKIDSSEWATPLVPLVQGGKKLRICGDYKVTINPDLIDENYSIPMIHDIFHKMKHGKFFCTLDVYKAYLHIEVDDKTAEIQTINTQNGLYRMNRMMFGSKNAPKIFQRLMDTMLEGLEGTASFFDDVIVQGRNVAETTERLRKVLQRLKQYDMHLNLKKCKFFEKSVKYLGHRIDDKGKHKLKDKVEAILKAPRPRCVTELKSFLGLVHYYGKFVKHLSTVLHPLNKLLHRNSTFQWSESCERSFISVKHSIADQSFLVPYDPNLPLVLATDASPHAIGAILSHIQDGQERPIEFASKSLTSSELKYSPVDKKAAAIHWGLKKFYQFCYGRNFTLITDREALEAILKGDKRRMKRFAQYLSQFTYDVRYRNATDHANADFLAEFPVQDEDSSDSTESASAESENEE